MNEAWEQLKPKDSFSVVLGNHIGDIDYKVLNLLYQPIIGIDAYGLMNTLLVESDIMRQTNQPQFLHTILLDRLDLGIPQLYQARVKLEAVGLLKTFVRLTDSHRHFVYEIQKPLDPGVFLSDDVLSLLLLEKIGEERLKVMADKFSFKRQDMEDYTEVTRNFMQVFPFDPLMLSSYQESLSQIKEKVIVKEETATVQLNIATFDWDFFLQTLGSLPVDNDQLTKELKKTIETFHYLYGINELDMQDYIKQSLDYVTNKVNVKEFKQLVYKQYHKRRKQNDVPAMPETDITANLTVTEKKTLKENTLKLDGFSEGEIAVLKACESTPPMIFLKALKTQKKGFVSSNERWTVENLKTQSGLPDAVINVLIHYMLVVQGHSSLNQNMVNSIANDWSQSQIYAPETALNKVKEFQESRTAAQTTKKRSYNKGQVRKETLPDWAQETNRRKETPLSSEEQAFFEEELRKLNSNRKDGDH
ncbi:MAG: replication initiation and membrane attachment family protein [Vagococcus sp.]